jgi:hypothetical protein
MYCFALSDFCDNPQHSILIGANIRIFVTDKLTPLNSFLLEKLTAAEIGNKFPAIYGTRKFIPCPHERSTGPCPETTESNPHPHTLFPEHPIILSSHLHL